MLKEINFDGIIGPSHNYAGLSLGNIASASHGGQTSHPREAALQGLAKMRGNMARGLPQGYLLPLPRPNPALTATLALDGSEDPALRAAPGPPRQCGRPMPPPSPPRPIPATGAAT